MPLMPSVYALRKLIHQRWSKDPLIPQHHLLRISLVSQLRLIPVRAAPSRRLVPRIRICLKQVTRLHLMLRMQIEIDLQRTQLLRLVAG